MSRLAKKGITIPDKTEVKVDGGHVSVKGPAGELSREFPGAISISVEGNLVTLTPKSDSIESRALWGTVASHISNMVEGSNKPFEKKLEIQGIGYKAEVKGDKLVMALGFSHPVEMTIPKDLKVTAEKGMITVSGVDKEKVGSFAAELRSFKKPEPYKGKGIRYEGEVVKMKQGKKSV